MKRIIIVSILAVVVAAVFIFQRCGSHADPQQAPAMGRGRGGGSLHVNVEVLARQTLTDELHVTGILLPDEDVNLSFETSGKVTEVLFAEGARVRKGDLLARVNDAHLQASLRKLSAQLPLARNRVSRQRELFERDIVSSEALEQATTDLEALQAEIDAVKAQIEYTCLRAPFDGVAGLRLVSPGAYVTPATVVCRLTRCTPLKVEFAIPERYSEEVAVGTEVLFAVDGHLEPFAARVYACEGAVDRATHTLNVRALYANADGRLRPGRYASISLTKQTIDSTVTVPSEAIVPEMGKDKVFVYSNGKAMPVEIKAGLRTEARVQVLDGLAEGDTLIVTGTLQLRTGLDVVIDE